MSLACGVFFGGDAQDGLMGATAQPLMEHDRARVIELGTVLVKQIMGDERAFVDTAFDYTRIWTRQDENAQRGSLEVKGHGRPGLRGDRHGVLEESAPDGA